VHPNSSDSHPIPDTPNGFVFDKAPWLVYWEVTRACNLACRHCRADAQCYRHPDELDFAEGTELLWAIRRFGDPPPHLVITGGDPLKRPDLFQLIVEARRIGIPVSLAPSVTDLMDESLFPLLRALGVSAVSLSLDGASAEVHDGIRGVPGCFDRTLTMAKAAVDSGLALQINTLVTAGTRSDLEPLSHLMEQLDITRWSLFFLIPVGRGGTLAQLSPDESESLMEWLAEQIPTLPFQVKTTEAPHWRRVLIQRLRDQGWSMSQIRKLPMARGFGVRDGNGIMFVSHTGEIYPSGFLPLSAGNVRDDDLVNVYREGSVFQRLRNPDGFNGKCGRCEYRWICGGSRARAYAASGDALQEDPLCPYQPRVLQRIA
jgi:AdoMet-dependent heme synthase